METTLAADEYRCALCQEVFTKGWSDEEAKAEAEENFPGLAEGDACLVCDDCYKRLTK